VSFPALSARARGIAERAVPISHFAPHHGEPHTGESAERVRALRPAIAIGILVSTEQVPGHRLQECEFAGELGLSGEFAPIRDALAMTLKACGDGRTFVLPATSAAERLWSAMPSCSHCEQALGRARQRHDVEHRIRERSC
jgi:hypothetical protein